MQNTPSAWTLAFSADGVFLRVPAAIACVRRRSRNHDVINVQDINQHRPRLRGDDVK
jgi:hypothetical protein